VDLQAQPSRRLKASKDFIPFCRQIQETRAGRSACLECDCEAIRRLRDTRRPVLYSCHMGLLDLVVPLLIGGQLIGALAAGQFLLRKPARETFRALRNPIQTFGLDASLAEKHYLKVPVLTPAKTRAVVDLLALIADHLIKIEFKLDALRKHTTSNRFVARRNS